MKNQINSAPLTEKTYYRGISALTSLDTDLAVAVSKWGRPPFWTHTPGFMGIVLAILSQQVSLESAQATFTKLEHAIGSINPKEILSLDEQYEPLVLLPVGFPVRRPKPRPRLAPEDILIKEIY